MGAQFIYFIQFDVEMGAWCLINNLYSRGLFVVGFVVGYVCHENENYPSGKCITDILVVFI